MREMRDSGVGYLGEIPAEWGVVPVRAIWSEVRRPVETGEPEDLLSVSEYYGVDYRKNRIGESGTLMRAESLRGYQICEPGNLVMNIMLAWKGAQGVSQCRGLVSPSYAVFKPADEIEPRFYHYLFRSSLYTDAFRLHSTGLIDSRLRLYPHVFIRMHTVVPPPPEQRRIAGWLDERCADIDAAVEAARASIDEYEAYKKSVISHAVTRGLDPDTPLKDTGIPWLGQIPAGWETIKQKYLMTFTNGRAYAQNEFQSEGKYRVLRVGNCNTNSTWYYSDMELAEDKYCDNGDLLYLWSTTFGPYIWTGEKVIYHYHIWKVEPREEILFKRYAYYLLEAESDWQRSQTHGFTMVHITKAGMEGTYAPLPPLSEQRAIADYLDSRTAAIDAVVAQKRAIVEDLSAYKKSLIYEAVTGKREV